MDSFTPFSALLGGLLIGLSAALFLLLNGRIAGISGILGGLLSFTRGEAGWRLAFLAGVLAAPLVYSAMGWATPAVIIHSRPWLLVIAGLLVGFGTRLGSGCTSGHGVCGIARGSPRSLAATGVFMTVAGVTVFISRHVFGD